jgi:uncharacterized protein YndB with AHSA1/START domain
MGEQSIRVQRHSSAPPSAIYPLLADVPGWPRWAPAGAKAAYVREGSPDVGGVGAIRRMGGYGLSVDEEILEARPPHYQRYTILRGAPVKNYCGEVHLEPAGSGTALLWTVRFTATVPGLGPGLRIALGFLIDLVAKALLKMAESDFSGSTHSA